MRLMFESALRVSEIQRITLNKIKPNEDYYEIFVRGKRNNIDPVSISSDLYHAITDYIDRYNQPLDDDDPRRIRSNTPVFQRIHIGDNHLHTAKYTNKGLTSSGISRIVHRQTKSILGDEFACKPHDCRRTFAYIAYTQGMDIRDISRALRHSDVAITWRYIGIQPDNQTTLLTNYVKIA